MFLATKKLTDPPPSPSLAMEQAGAKGVWGGRRAADGRLAGLSAVGVKGRVVYFDDATLRIAALPAGRWTGITFDERCRELFVCGPEGVFAIDLATDVATPLGCELADVEHIAATGEHLIAIGSDKLVVFGRHAAQLAPVVELVFEETVFDLIAHESRIVVLTNELDTTRVLAIEGTTLRELGRVKQAVNTAALHEGRLLLTGEGGVYELAGAPVRSSGTHTPAARQVRRPRSPK